MSRPNPGPLLLGEFDRGDATRPVLSTGLSAAVVGSRAGDVALSWETRGAPLDWGGVYAQGIRLTGPWTLGGVLDEGAFDLPTTLRSSTVRRSRLRSEHAWGPVRVVQDLFAAPRAPGVVRRLSLTTDRERAITLRSRWAPFLAPVLVEGIKPYDYRLRRVDLSLEAEAHGHAVRFDSDPPASGWSIGGTPWGSGTWTGEVGSLESRHELFLEPGRTTSATFVLWGGLRKTVEAERDLGARLIGGAVEGLAREADRSWEEWFARTPTLVFPDDPGLERAYDLARGALRALYTEPEPGMRALVAGFPWYAAIWCRDAAWMLPAVLWLGDSEWAEATLATVFRYQANARIPLLGAEPGELPMQVSPGPVFLFGTSDTTLYYPGLVARLVDHTGRTDRVADWWRHLEAVAAWGTARTDPTTGLVTNGGEVEEIRDASASMGKVHYGFDAVDTTIWDSTDRRAHAIDIEVLWVEALRSLAALAPEAGRPVDPAPWNARADAVAATIASAYKWPEEEYLADTIGRDGRAVHRLRPNALRAVGAGLVDAALARAVVARAGRDDLTTPWGVRTLGSQDPAYDPTAYHDGQVWPIATAWAADAAYAVGDAAGGFAHLRRLGERLVREEGLANECYRGDSDEPFDSCFLLGFSVAPFLTLLFERLWGLRPAARRRHLEVRPRFPATWGSAGVSGLAFAGGTVDLAWTPGALRVAWHGEGVLSVDAGSLKGTRSAGEVRFAVADSANADK